MIILRLVGLRLPSFGTLWRWIVKKNLAIWMCVCSFLECVEKVVQSHQNHPQVSELCFISQSEACQQYSTALSLRRFNTGFTKSFSFRDNLYLLVLQQNSSYLSFKKLLGTHGPQVGNFPSLAQCLYCSARNAVVVLTLQWLGRTLLRSTTWSQTASDMPSRVSPTASLRDRRQSESV